MHTQGVMATPLRDRNTTSGVHYFSNNSTARRQLFLTYWKNMFIFVYLNELKWIKNIDIFH